MSHHRYKESPLWNQNLPLQERIDYLLTNMTLEEKMSFLATTTPAIERLGISSFHIGGEAAHGIVARNDQNGSGIPDHTTAFTQPIGMSSSWDEESIEKVGEIAGTEARVLYNRNKRGGLSRWAPTVDMERDPRWGRTEEAYGEDPYLAGKMASAYIRGLQGTDDYFLRMAASVKHFYANNVEEGRIWKSSSIDPRNKYEYYLEPFRRTVVEGKAEAMMTAYNEINGIPAILNHEVQNIVKDEWKLRGHVVCDGGDMTQTVEYHHYYDTHAETVAEGLKAGIDCFTDDPQIVEKAVKEAYERGLINEGDMDRALRNSFGTKIRLGIYDAESVNPYAKVSEENINSKEGREASLKMAEESIVLLQNNNNFLPLHKDDHVAVIGFSADSWYQDWYGGEPSYKVTLREGMKQLIGKEVLFDAGLPHIYLRVDQKYVGINEENILVLVENKEDGECFVWNDWGFGSSTLLSTSKEKYVSFYEEDGYLRADKEQVFGWFVKELFDLQESEDGILLLNWNKGKITVDDNETLMLSQTENSVLFHMEYQKDGILSAVETAQKADKVIMALGCNPVINSKEEIDRTDIILPPYQEKLIQEVFQANPNMVLVLITNYPYGIVWEKEHLPAIIQSATGSQDIGNAIVRILYGESSPSGRLPMTWYRSVDDLPDMDDYDIIKGKRTYRYFDKGVLYPFGHGLTYTKFAYDKLDVEAGETIKVNIEISNIGNCISDEVVQLYVKGLEHSRVVQPLKRLIGFKREKDIKPGETRHISMELSRQELALYDVISQSMKVEEGEYEFFVGGSSAHEEVCKMVFIPSELGIQIGLRNPYEKTDADHYDDYENIFLHKGVEGASCAFVKESEEKGKLVYRDFRWSGKVSQIVFHMKCEREGRIEILIENQSIGEFTSQACNEFMDQRLPIRNIFDTERVDICIVLEGDIGISYFRFE